VRAGVERSLKKLHRAWAERLGGDEDRAWALIGQCIGAIVIARTVESERTRREILAATRRVLDESVPEG